MSKLDLIRFWIHFPVGVICVFLLTFSVHLHWGLFVGFIVYEGFNDWRKVDWSYKDIYGFIFGYGIASLLLILYTHWSILPQATR